MARSENEDEVIEKGEKATLILSSPKSLSKEQLSIIRGMVLDAGYKCLIVGDGLQAQIYDHKLHDILSQQVDAINKLVEQNALLLQAIAETESEDQEQGIIPGTLS